MLRCVAAQECAQELWCNFLSFSEKTAGKISGRVAAHCPILIKVGPPFSSRRARRRHHASCNCCRRGKEGGSKKTIAVTATGMKITNNSTILTAHRQCPNIHSVHVLEDRDINRRRRESDSLSLSRISSVSICLRHSIMLVFNEAFEASSADICTCF